MALALFHYEFWRGTPAPPPPPPEPPGAQFIGGEAWVGAPPRKPGREMFRVRHMLDPEDEPLGAAVEAAPVVVVARERRAAGAPRRPAPRLPGPIRGRRSERAVEPVRPDAMPRVVDDGRVEDDEIVCLLALLN